MQTVFLRPAAEETPAMPLGDRVARLETEIVRLQDANGALFQKLGPVLGPEAPRPARLAHPGEGERSILADRIEAFISQVGAVADFLDVVRERVDL